MIQNIKINTKYKINKKYILSFNKSQNEDSQKGIFEVKAIPCSINEDISFLTEEYMFDNEVNDIYIVCVKITKIISKPENPDCPVQDEYNNYNPGTQITLVFDKINTKKCIIINESWYTNCKLTDCKAN